MGKCAEDNEIAPYKKKSKSSRKSKSSKRADHKHDYEKVVLESWLGFNWGSRCRICGRIDTAPFNYSMSNRRDFLKPETLDKPGHSARDYLSAEEIKKKFPGVRVFECDGAVRHGWKTYKEAEDDDRKSGKENV